MLLAEVLADLEANGTEQTKKTFLRHGAKEPFFGVKVEHLKKLQKKLKGRHELAIELYATGNSDAMYLAGLIVDPMKITKTQLKAWAKAAYWYMLSCFTVPWTASESRFGRELGLEWIDSKSEQVAACGWSTLGSMVAITDDGELDLAELVELLDRIPATIAAAKNRTKYAMNGFVIAVGTYVAPLLPKAKSIAGQLGQIEVDVGDTDCKVPVALDYLRKVEAMGRVGKKRKEAKC